MWSSGLIPVLLIIGAMVLVVGVAGEILYRKFFR